MYKLRDANRSSPAPSCHRSLCGGIRSAHSEGQTGDDSGKGCQLGDSCQLHGAETAQVYRIPVVTLPAGEDLQWRRVACDFPAQQVFYTQIRWTRYHRRRNFVLRFHLWIGHVQREVRFATGVLRRSRLKLSCDPGSASSGRLPRWAESSWLQGEPRSTLQSIQRPLNSPEIATSR